MKRIITMMLAAMLLLYAAGPMTALAEDTEKRLPSGIAYSEIGAKLEAYIAEHADTTVGLAVALYDKDGIIYSRNYGCTDKENNLPVREDSVFDWGSNSKLLVWVSVMQLYEQGKIDLDRDIRDYLPEDFPKFEIDKPLTMTNLMNHQGGFEEGYVGLAYDKKEDLCSLEEAVKNTSSVRCSSRGR